MPAFSVPFPSTPLCMQGKPPRSPRRLPQLPLLSYTVMLTLREQRRQLLAQQRPPRPTPYFLRRRLRCALPQRPGLLPPRPHRRRIPPPLHRSLYPLPPAHSPPLRQQRPRKAASLHCLCRWLLQKRSSPRGLVLRHRRPPAPPPSRPGPQTPPSRNRSHRSPPGLPSPAQKTAPRRPTLTPLQQSSPPPAAAAAKAAARAAAPRESRCGRFASSLTRTRRACGAKPRPRWSQPSSAQPPRPRLAKKSPSRRSRLPAAAAEGGTPPTSPTSAPPPPPRRTPHPSPAAPRSSLPTAGRRHSRNSSPRLSRGCRQRPSAGLTLSASRCTRRQPAPQPARREPRRRRRRTRSAP